MIEFTPPASPRLSPENVSELAAARKAARKIRRAVSVAQFDGWTIGLFAGVTFLFGITDPTSVILGMAMASVAFIELRGAKRMAGFDPAATRMLAYNQLALASVLIIYALWRLWAETHGHGELATLNDADLQNAMQSYEGLGAMVAELLYGSLIAIAIFGQGGLALYYLSRRKYIEAYVNETPAWIIDLQKTGVSI